MLILCPLQRPDNDLSLEDIAPLSVLAELDHQAPIPPPPSAPRVFQRASRTPKHFGTTVSVKNRPRAVRSGRFQKHKVKHLRGHGGPGDGLQRGLTI